MECEAANNFPSRVLQRYWYAYTIPRPSYTMRRAKRGGHMLRHGFGRQPQEDRHKRSVGPLCGTLPFLPRLTWRHR